MKAYTIIRNEEQYMRYCQELEDMTSDYQVHPSQELLDRIETVTLLIDKYDEDNARTKTMDPIQLLKALMEENKLTQKDLAESLGISKGHVSDILNRKKGLSKKVIRMLSEKFKVKQSAFNQVYPLNKLELA